MSRICPLFSGSSGNCTYLANGEDSILIDAGVSCRSIVGALKEIDAPVERIQAILVTHEHSDHVKGLKVLLKRYPIPVYGSRETLAYIAQNDLVPPQADLRVLEEKTEIARMEITPFDTSHDAAHSLGFRIHMADDRLVGFATDTGCITQDVDRGLSGCDVVVLESNYDKGMLQCGRYPYYLKRRITSNRGHLSNEDCAKQIARLVKEKATRFILAHLSQENNLPDIAYQSSLSQLLLEQMRPEVDFTLDVASRQQVSRMVTF
ncbi:MBL fold metallo-hydrolase [Zongyangia hominis]|uniref:MBL fold metallo-hydrolase n=1 Tax=Zongyangia hominis TaxID=2763677 RepID=A0A926ECE8_9FIRM|nr:MBL fold metallo-hydrolase [Zongyangia hominis]MBC8569381.1 MBL fold metallo-hydrolase [Zongyangia hominis]